MIENKKGEKIFFLPDGFLTSQIFHANSTMPRGADWDGEEESKNPPLE